MNSGLGSASVGGGRVPLAHTALRQGFCPSGKNACAAASAAVPAIAGALRPIGALRSARIQAT